MTAKKQIPVFIASPGDLVEERKNFRDTLEELNKGFGIGADVEFEPLGWEDTLAMTGRRNQSLINTEINRCKVFILCLHRRWGQEAPDSNYSSYTEEEFHLALDRFEKTGSPEIFVFFKRVDPSQEGDPGPQLEKVMRFRRSLEESRKVMYRYFEDKKEFKKEISKHLIAFSKGELPKVELEETKLFPLPVIEEVEKSKQQAQKALKEAEHANERAEQAFLKTEILQLEIAEDAADAANRGKLETARQKFAKAVDGTTNIEVLSLAYEFYYRTGELKLAKTYLNQWLTISGENTKSADTAKAYGNLGNIYQTRGELNKAEEYYRQALEINQSLSEQQGIANQYGNLGTTYRIRGKLDKAEEYFLRALKIDKSLNRQKAMARSYGGLGIINENRGESDRAEEYYRQALEINQSLGEQQGIANQYGNLGNIYEIRGELETAEQYYYQALEINQSLGRQQGMAIQYGNLGNIYKTRGKLDKAEEYYLKSLKIEESLGRQEGMASDYGNLGTIYGTQGDLDKATKYLLKSVELFKNIGAEPMIIKVQGFLDALKEEQV